MRIASLLLLAACSSSQASAPDAPPSDARPADAQLDAPASLADAAGTCSVFGAPGDCIAMSSCSGDHTAYAGACPGTPADIQCCIVTPSVANNPPQPTGYHLMPQGDVTPAMTDWAVAILHDPHAYPMFATTTMAFPTQPQPVLARVEWHPPDFQNNVIHRGVTLYEHD